MPTLNPPHAPAPWADAPLTARLVLADGTVIAGHGPRRHRLRRRRGLLQHGHDRLPGDPHRSLLRRPDHHLHLSPHRQRRHQHGGHRDLQPRHALGRARLRAARRRHRALELSRRRAARPLAEGARHHRHRRRRHARADRAHPRAGHAERRHRARAVGHVRPRQAQGRGQGLARASTAGPRARRDEPARATPGTRCAWVWGEGYGAAGATRSCTSSPSTTASSATSCAASPRRAAR